MTITQPSPLLRFALRLDAGVSFVSGLPLVFASGWLADRTQLPAQLIWVAGLICLPYALLLFWMASRTRLSRMGVMALVVGNFLWADAALVLMLGFFVTPNFAGQALLLTHVLATALFAILQWMGLKRSSESAPLGLHA